MNKQDRRRILEDIGQDWLEFIMDRMTVERVLGLLQGVLVGWCISILILSEVYRGDTMEVPRYVEIISAVILGLIVLGQVWGIARLTNR